MLIEFKESGVEAILSKFADAVIDIIVEELSLSKQFMELLAVGVSSSGCQV